MRDLVPSLIKNESIDLAIANAENAAGGMGVDIKSAGALFSAGIHVLTSGNHIWKKKEIYSYLDQQVNLIRPANFPPAPLDGAGANGKTPMDSRHSSLIFKGEFLCRTTLRIRSAVSMRF